MDSHSYAEMMVPEDSYLFFLRDEEQNHALPLESLAPPGA